ncbi:MAG TPA: hypothetical protein VG013_41550 [Gemmataceae bacterium]|jgi:Flp pilus assembly protein TadD|nr:hypothetical protein [Gemmataceae bacterium]
MTGKTRKQQIQDMLADDPSDPFLHYGLGMEHISDGADEEAVRCFQELFRVAPDYVPAYLQAGQALTRLGRPAEARDAFSRGIAVARKQGDQHAAEEMQGFLSSI